jgi:hypothetical protein
MLSQDVKTFATKDAMQAAIETKLKSVAQMDLKNIADKIVFCYPSKSPGSWIASASLNYWRATFNNQFCVSLSAGMHEIGHTIGLLHSAKGLDDYADTTGYLGYSSSSVGTPSKCYNGYKNWNLGWYQGRRESVSTSKVIRLVAFVDFQKAAANEPVLVQVNSKFYIQYNRAKSFNSQTDLHRDKVTVTTTQSNGNSLNLAGLGVGQSYVNGATKIKVCSKQTGSAGQDVMVVAIGKARCPKKK